MTEEPCRGAKGHFDGASAVAGLLLGTCILSVVMGQCALEPVRDDNCTGRFVAAKSGTDSMAVVREFSYCAYRLKGTK